MRVVVVDQNGSARIVEASREINQDLFWGLRGSGHLFGVVVEAKFRAQPWQHDTWHSCLVFSPADAGTVAEAMDRIHYTGGMQGRLVFCAPNQQVRWHGHHFTICQVDSNGTVCRASSALVRWATPGGRKQVRVVVVSAQHERAPNELSGSSHSVS